MTTKTTDLPGRDATSLEPTTGLVAILDALGAADYSMERVRDYLESRSQLLEQVRRFAEKKHKGLVQRFAKAQIDWFVFQDTIILVYVSQQPIALAHVAWFGLVLRAFLSRAIEKNLLFRGAFSMGQLYKVSTETNTVLGPAVRDAARWYEQAQWMGVHATPRTSLIIQSLASSSKESIGYALVPYAVPFKESASGLELHSVNWPKGMHLRRPDDDATVIRGGLASCLAHDEIPRGVEPKQFNSLAFFDRVVQEQGLKQSWNKRLSLRKAGAAKR